jgi:hypothetical protein
VLSVIQILITTSWPLCCLLYRFSLTLRGHCVVCPSLLYGFWLPLLCYTDSYYHFFVIQILITTSLLYRFRLQLLCYTDSNYHFFVIQILFTTSLLYRFWLPLLCYTDSDYHFFVIQIPITTSLLYRFWLPLLYLQVILLIIKETSVLISSGVDWFSIIYRKILEDV